MPDVGHLTAFLFLIAFSVAFVSFFLVPLSCFNLRSPDIQLCIYAFIFEMCF